MLAATAVAARDNVAESSLILRRRNERTDNTALAPDRARGSIFRLPNEALHRKAALHKKSGFSTKASPVKREFLKFYVGCFACSQCH